jgi:GNAT superfamily N-acetyltransferase
VAVGRESIPLADVEIRLACEADLPEIETLARAIWPASYAGVISDEQIAYMLDWMYSQTQLTADFAAGIRFDLLEIHGEAAGFVSYGPVVAGETVKLHKLYLMPGTRGQGLGSKLLQHAEAVCFAAQAAAMELRVNRGNTSAVRAYLRNGWLLDREDCNDIGRGFVMDDFVFVKKLKDCN